MLRLKREDTTPFFAKELVKIGCTDSEPVSPKLTLTQLKLPIFNFSVHAAVFQTSLQS